MAGKQVAQLLLHEGVRATRKGRLNQLAAVELECHAERVMSLAHLESRSVATEN